MDPPRMIGSPRDMQRRRLLRLASGLLLAGCGSAPKPSMQIPSTPQIAAAVPLLATALVITVKALPDINPDIRGRSSPLALRIFELKSAAAFEAADFFALYEREAATLGGELVASEQVIVKPEETRTLARVAALETRYLGVVAAIRDLEHSVWRQVAPVAPPQPLGQAAEGPRTQRFTVVCQRAGIRLVAE